MACCCGKSLNCCNRRRPNSLVLSAFGGGTGMPSVEAHDIALPLGTNCGLISGVPANDACYISEVFCLTINEECEICMQVFVAACNPFGSNHFIHFANPADPPTPDNPSCSSLDGSDGCTVSEEQWNILVAFSSNSPDTPETCPCGVNLPGLEWFCLGCIQANDPNFSCNPISLAGSFNPALDPVFNDETGEYDCHPLSTFTITLVVTEAVEP